MDSKKYIGRIVSVSIDRPLGSVHPKRSDIVYKVNYGFVPDTVSGDGDELDCYVLGIDYPIKEYKGKCIAVIRRLEEDDDKLIIVPDNQSYSNEEIEQLIMFQEQYFKHIILK